MVAHVTGRFPVDDEGGPGAGPHQLVELGQVDPGHRSRGNPAAAGGVDDHVDAAEGRHRLGEEPGHVQIVSDVSADGDRVAVVGQDRFDGRLGRPLVVQVVDDDGESLAARRQVVARPTPRDPPVTMATRPAADPLNAVVMAPA